MKHRDFIVTKSPARHTPVPTDTAGSDHPGRLTGRFYFLFSLIFSFGGGCRAWYTDEHDHNFTLWPRSVARYRRELRRPIRGEFATRRRG